MSTATFDIECRAYDRATGVRLPVNPKLFTNLTYSYVERGGAEMATASIKLPFESVPVNNGDSLEIWALNSNEIVPRWRGNIGVVERNLKMAEESVLTAYGRMEDMMHAVIDKVIVHPNSLVNGATEPGADLSVFAADIYADYVARLSQSTAAYQPWTNFVTDIQVTGINLSTLDASLTTARAAMDALADQAGTNVVWGWDIDPIKGFDRFYVRPRS
jgi:hypothetical protein